MVRKSETKIIPPKYNTQHRKFSQTTDKIKISEFFLQVHCV